LVIGPFFFFTSRSFFTSLDFSNFFSFFFSFFFLSFFFFFFACIFLSPLISSLQVDEHEAKESVLFNFDPVESLSQLFG